MSAPRPESSSGLSLKPYYYGSPTDSDFVPPPRPKVASEGQLIPVGMNLYIWQTGYNDMLYTTVYRIIWLIAAITMFGLQFLSWEKGLLPFRLTFWYLILAILCFFFGSIHIIGKCLDKSGVTRVFQCFYVVALCFTMGTSVFYIFLLFMDDLSRQNPRKDNMYVILSDGFYTPSYLRTGPLTDPDTTVEFFHWKNEAKTIWNEQRYGFMWFYHIVCHVVLPIVLAIPLYVENTRIYYTDLFWSILATFAYSMWLWIGSRVIYNRDAAKPCIGNDLFYCNPDKVNPEYRIIYTKLNFFQRETAAYILLLHLFVFVTWYIARAVSKRFARSAALHYKYIGREVPATHNIANFQSVPDEGSQKAGDMGEGGARNVPGKYSPRSQNNARGHVSTTNVLMTENEPHFRSMMPGN